jgi:hypothetical protein
VTLSAHPIGNNVSFLIGTSDQTATSANSCGANVDYGDSGSQLMTFTPSSPTVQTFFVTTCSDTRDEDNETFRVSISQLENATALKGDATGTLIDDDDPPRLTIANASAPEGNGSGTINFRVAMSEVSGREVKVAYIVTTMTGPNHANLGTNCGGSVDVLSTPGTLTIPPGQNGGTISIPVCGDSLLEDNETFSVTLSEPVNATIQNAVAIGTLLNDERPGVSISDANRGEGSPPTPANSFGHQKESRPSPNPLVFTISLNHPAAASFPRTWRTNTQY